MVAFSPRSSFKFSLVVAAHARVRSWPGRGADWTDGRPSGARSWWTAFGLPGGTALPHFYQDPPHTALPSCGSDWHVRRHSRPRHPPCESSASASCRLSLFQVELPCCLSHWWACCFISCLACLSQPNQVKNCPRHTAALAPFCSTRNSKKGGFR